MHFAETFTPEIPPPVTKVITFEGEARSGKGTSRKAVGEQFRADGRSVVEIDQGQKFRALTRLGLSHDGSDDLFDNQGRLGEFIQDERTIDNMISLLADLSKQGDDSTLYEPDVAGRVSQVGKNPYSHQVATDSLRRQVGDAVEAGVDSVLVDGRCMEKYGRMYATEQLTQYVLGFYFTCDVSVAACRSAGIFIDHTSLSIEQRLGLLDEIIKIRDRNRDDTLRQVDSMVEPVQAHTLDLETVDLSDDEGMHELMLDVLHRGMVKINTSYTGSVKEMIDPVVAIASRAARLQDAERQRFAEDKYHWGSYEPWEDSRYAILTGLDGQEARVIRDEQPILSPGMRRGAWLRADSSRE